MVQREVDARRLRPGIPPRRSRIREDRRHREGEPGASDSKGVAEPVPRGNSVPVPSSFGNWAMLAAIEDLWFSSPQSNFGAVPGRARAPTHVNWAAAMPEFVACHGAGGPSLRSGVRSRQGEASPNASRLSRGHTSPGPSVRYGPDGGPVSSCIRNAARSRSLKPPAERAPRRDPVLRSWRGVAGSRR